MILVVFFLNQAWGHTDSSEQAIETPRHFTQFRICTTQVTVVSKDHRRGSNPLKVYSVPRGSPET
jgi:hypothetical protein